MSFGDFVLDLDTRDCDADANRLSLSPKAYQLLEMLVESRPKALSKIALQERLWPDTFVVEKNLINLIAERPVRDPARTGRSILVSVSRFRRV
jgi:DNA-binding winged helix-turn-helix (wHTH) protein